ncbi:MAG: RelA/SpoT family protein [Micromonosporaceae bacterium]|nr:RelA/SpoT family protein [Micromonosporaceae bacterium]
MVNTRRSGAEERASPPGDTLARLVRAVLPWPSRPHSPYEKLVRVHRSIHPKANLPLLHHAHHVAHKMHDGQVRRSGEPYISHPIAVARILAELGMDTTTLVAALLHDTVEDTTCTLEALRKDFGDSVAHLVDGVTKLDGVFFGASAEAETIRKLIIAAGEDVRVIVIKLADRLHNMRTLRFKSRPSQVRKAQATRDVLVPLADRLGIHVFKRELEDLVLATLDPEAYECIDRHVNAQPSRAGYLRTVMGELACELRAARVHATVTDRPRHYWSIYSDMQSSPSRQPHDMPRIVIRVAGDMTDCYAALGAVHGLYRPAPGRFKDFIATPKFNLYQSLHTTVIGPDNEPLEVLVRTEEMHHTAEYGVVAQYRGRDLSEPHEKAASSRTELDWLRRLLDWQRETSDSSEFLASLHSDLSSGQIQIFTSGGDQIMLPTGATPVDLAYAISTPTGDRLIGAYVNGRLATVTAMLDDGDVVEIISASGNDYPGPSREWLSAVRTPQAQRQINQWYDGRDADSGDGESGALTSKIQAGRLAVSMALRRRGRALAGDAPLINLARKLGYPDAEALFVAITETRLRAEEIAEQLIASVDRTAPDSADRA